MELGKTKAKPKREGTETIQGVVVSYKKPYFTVLYDDGDEDFLTLAQVQSMDSGEKVPPPLLAHDDDDQR